jgi:hypothetical protein
MPAARRKERDKKKGKALFIRLNAVQKKAMEFSKHSAAKAFKFRLRGNKKRPHPGISPKLGKIDMAIGRNEPANKKGH